MREENIRDITSLGGNPVYIAAAILFWLFGFGSVTYQLAAGLVLCYIATTVLRITFFRQRPKKQQFRNALERIDASSFPSLHAMRATVLALIIAVFFNQPIVWILATLAVLAVAVTRVMLKRHHRSDVIAGLVVGVIIAFISITLVSSLL